MALNPAQLLQLAQGAGFKGQDVQTMAAIAMAESSGNPGAHNRNASTGDNSYGLAQINMLGSMGPARLKQFGLQKNEQLFDPQTNFKAAKQVRDSSGFGAWSTYGSGKYKQFLPQVQKASAGVLPESTTSAPATSAPTTQQGSAANTYNIYLNGTQEEGLDFLSSYLPKLTGQQDKPRSMFDPMAMLSSAFNTNYSA
jgi:hypothetical protein